MVAMAAIHTLSPLCLRPLPPQGAVVGLVAGLVMAFWIGIGNFIMRMPGPSPLPPLNATDLPLIGNMTTAMMTTAMTTLSPVTTKPR